MAITAAMRTQITELYVALFGRAPDSEGLGFWVQKLDAGMSLAAIANAMYATDPARAYYPSWMTNSEIITSFYVNVLGRTPDAEGLAYWLGKLNAPGATFGSVVTQMIDVVMHYTGTNPDGLTSAALFQNKVAVAQWFGENIGTIANSTTVLSFVTATTTPAAAEAAFQAYLLNANGQTFTLTTAVDNVVGTPFNDKIVGSDTTYQTFDNVDGGAGRNSLTINDLSSTTLAAATFANVKNVQDLIVNHQVNAIGLDATILDVELMAGLQTVTVNVANASVLFPAATPVVITSGSNATTISINDLNGINGAAIPGATAIGTVFVTDTGTTTGTTTTDTLSTVNLDGINAGGGVTITSDALVNLGLANSSVGVLVGNALAHTLNLNVNGDAAGAGVVDATATTVNLSSNTAASTLALTAAAATTLNINGGAKVTLGVLDQTKLTTINGASDTGGIVITPTLANGVAFTGGIGNDTVTIGATTKAINMGAGNDTVNFTVFPLGLGGTVNGGDGTDTMGMSSALAAAASATTKFNAVVSNFERLSLGQTAGDANDVVDVSNLNAVNYVRSAGTAAGTAVQEVQTFTVSASDATGGEVLVAGVPVIIANGATNSDVAAAIAAASASIIAANPGISSITANGNTVTVTWLSSAGNVGNIALAQNPSGVAVSGVSVVTPGVTEQMEQQTISVSTAPASSGFFTIGGVQVNVTLGQTTAQVASAIATALNGASTSSGTVATAVAVGSTVTVTFATAGNKVALPVVSSPLLWDTNSNGVLNGTESPPTVTDNATPYGPPTSEVQSVTITSGTDATGGSILVNGARIDLAPNLSIDQVGGAIAASIVAVQAADPSVQGITYNTFTDTLTFTYTLAAGNVSDTRTSVIDNASSVTFGAVNTVANGFNGTQNGMLTIANIATGGTFELTGANNGSVEIQVTGADLNTADSFNLILKNAGNLVGGMIKLADVEAVNITTVDTNTTPAGNTDSLTLLDAAATSIKVAGSAGLNLTFTGKALTSFDASGVTQGAVTWTTGALSKAATIIGSATKANTIDFSAATKAVTYTGGSGVDTVTANNSNNVINTDGGNDVVFLGNGANTVDLGAGNDYVSTGTTGKAGLNVITGGSGADLFDIFTPLNGQSYSTITDFNDAGDSVRLYAGTFTKAAVGPLAATAVFQDYLDASVASVGVGGIRWFQWNGDTYIVQDRGGDSATFTNGEDVVVKLSGLHNLATEVTFDGVSSLVHN